MRSLIITTQGPIYREVRHRHVFRGVLVGAIRDKGYLVMVRTTETSNAWFPIHVIRKMK